MRWLQFSGALPPIKKHESGTFFWLFGNNTAEKSLKNMHEKSFFSPLLFPQFSPNSIPYGGQRRAKVSFSFLENKSLLESRNNESVFWNSGSIRRETRK